MTAHVYSFDFGNTRLAALRAVFGHAAPAVGVRRRHNKDVPSQHSLQNLDRALPIRIPAQNHLQVMHKQSEKACVSDPG